jgi:hypothetical protein
VIKASWGEVSVSLRMAGLDVETNLPGRYGITPAMIATLKNSPGIRAVSIA